MDGRDSAECQNPRLEDMEGINRIVNEEKNKILNSGLLLQKTKNGLKRQWLVVECRK